MATRSRSSSFSSAGPRRRHPHNWALKFEQYCCTVAKYFPLVFVYGLTTWAVWVVFDAGFVEKKGTWIGIFSAKQGLLCDCLIDVWKQAQLPRPLVSFFTLY